MTRIAELQRRLPSERLDRLVITHLPNIFYLSNFTGSAGALLVGPRAATLFTDGRYAIQAREEVRGAAIRIVRGSLFAAVGESLRGRRRLRVAFEPTHLTVAQEKLFRWSAGPSVKWVGWDGAVEKLRLVKSGEELQRMRAAADVVSRVFEEIVPLIKPGVREFELAAEIEYRMCRRGVSGAAFATIVASGKRAALPHARPSSKPLSKNELVVIDLGAILAGHCSDMTRTVFLGRAPGRIRGWYAAVREAQEAARDALRPGASAGDVDAAAREVLRRRGLGRHFVHSTGHGLGIEVHEAPRLGPNEKVRLEAGNVVTLEPGVYIPGTGGIRVEDDVVVLAQGTEVLTSATREFLEL